MIEYGFAGGIVHLAQFGVYTPTEVDEALDRVARDPAVPEGVPFLFSWAITDVAQFQRLDVRGRLTNLKDRLGPKLGRACAMVIAGTAGTLKARDFQYEAERMNLRLGVFDDEASARHWLSAYCGPAGKP